MDHERYFPAAPGQVFAALINALSTSGEVYEIGAMGSSVTFATQRFALNSTLRLQASVQPHDQGTLMRVLRADRGDLGAVNDEDAELARLRTLLDRVERHFAVH